MDVEGTSLSLHVKNFFKVLDFALKLLHNYIVLRVYFVRSYADHHLLSSISKLERRNAFLDALGKRRESSNEYGASIETKRVFKQPRKFAFSIRNNASGS